MVDVDLKGVPLPDSMKTAKGMQQHQRFTSPNTAVEPAQSGPVRIKIREPKEGQGLIELALDYSKAEVPTRAYFADYVQVFEGRADVTLIFGRLIPGTKQLRTQIEISFSRDSFVAQLWKSSRAMHASIRENKDTLPLPRIEAELSQVVHTSRANNVFMAILGEEAILDFYYIAPSDIHFVRLGHRSQVNLEPVIRISLPSPLLLEFLEECDALVSKMPETARIMKREEEIGA